MEQPQSVAVMPAGIMTFLRSDRIAHRKMGKDEIRGDGDTTMQRSHGIDHIALLGEDDGLKVVAGGIEWIDRKRLITPRQRLFQTAPICKRPRLPFIVTTLNAFRSNIPSPPSKFSARTRRRRD